MRAVEVNSKTICPLMARIFSRLPNLSSIEEDDSDQSQVEMGVALMALGRVFAESVGSEPEAFELPSKMMAQCFLDAAAKNLGRQEQEGDEV